jgi:hypothetical protein
MKQNLKDDITLMLLKNKSICMILYVLSQIPSYTQELTEELSYSKLTIDKAIHYLNKNKLIRVLDINSTRNSDLYPLLLKKIKKIKSQVPLNKTKSALKELKFFFITQKGTKYLPLIQQILFRKDKK